MDSIAISVLVLFLSVVVVFAQLKMFSMDKTLKEIRDELKARKGA